MIRDHQAALLELAPTRVLPVTTVHDAAQADVLAEALSLTGVRGAEVTLRSAFAPRAIRLLADRGVPVAAGTVLTADDVRAARDAGAVALVSPGWSDEVAAAAADADLPWLPGVATPSEVMRAIDAGYRVLKFFPAVESGGAAFLRALAGPFSGVRFVPTGGIDERNLSEFLALDSVVVVGGGWLTRFRPGVRPSLDEVVDRMRAIPGTVAAS